MPFSTKISIYWIIESSVEIPGEKAVLDHYFENLSVEPVSAGDGWSRIRVFPRLFPGLE
jgi:hypothetical protein